MSGVVLRCPHCGTTRTSGGECEACHEAQVRYFCDNHSPGRWLDAARCEQCGARFGEAKGPASPTSPAAPAATAAPATPASPARRPTTSGARSTGPFAPRRPPAPTEATRSVDRTRRRRGSVVADPVALDGEPGHRGGFGHPDEVDDPAPGSPRGSWRDLLVALARTHSRRTEAEAEREAAEHRRRPRGCIARLLWMVALAFFAVFSVVNCGGSVIPLFLPF